MNRTAILFNRRAISGMATMLLAGTFAACMLVSPLCAQYAGPAAKPATTGAPARYQPDRFPKRAAAYYALFWGIDSLSVKTAESGELVRFSYRVLDPARAKAINEKDTEAYLIAPDAHARLVIPTLEKVGKLRQTTTPEPGKSYWMAFSNPARTVKRGDRVNIAIGQFHADGLVVE